MIERKSNEIGEQRKPRVVQMPDVDTMQAALSKAGLFGAVPQEADPLYRFIGLTASTKRGGATLNIDWEIASSKAPNHPFIEAILGMRFNGVMGLIVPDPEVVAEAIRIRDEIIGERLAK